MRYSRLFLGLATILFALWIILGEQISGVSSDAVVNARVSTVRTPVSGTLTMPFRAFGTKLVKGEAMAAVTDPLVDNIRLNDLRMEREFSEVEVARLTRLAADTEAEMKALASRAEVYRQRRIAEIRVRLVRAQERVALLETGAPAGSQGDAGASGTVSPDIVPDVALSYAREQVEVLAIALAAAEQGVFLGDGYNDAPGSEQRLIQLRATRDTLTVDLASTEARIAMLDVRIGLEERRVNQLGTANLNAPTDGILWEVLASDGEVVQRGQDIMRLMGCDSALVTLSVSDVVYNRLRVGQTAKFRLNGTKALYDGTITRIAGSGAETIYRNLAVAPSLKHLERFDVALLVPSLRTNPELRCAVGQTGRVFFDTRPLDWLRRFFD